MRRKEAGACQKVTPSLKNQIKTIRLFYTKMSTQILLMSLFRGVAHDRRTRRQLLCVSRQIQIHISVSLTYYVADVEGSSAFTFVLEFSVSPTQQPDVAGDAEGEVPSIGTVARSFYDHGRTTLAEIVTDVTAAYAAILTPDRTMKAFLQDNAQKVLLFAPSDATTPMAKLGLSITPMPGPPPLAPSQPLANVPLSGKNISH